MDIEELQSLFAQGTVIDASVAIDVYDYQQNAGIRLVAKKLIIHRRWEMIGFALRPHMLWLEEPWNYSVMCCMIQLMLIVMQTVTTIRSTLEDSLDCQFDPVALWNVFLYWIHLGGPLTILSPCALWTKFLL